MTEASLGPSSYIVLGLLSQHGAGTSYDLKRWADGSVGYFWTFPRSQLYAEPQRLVGLGLLSEQQEETGRRKRLFRLTDAGRAALQAWLASAAGMPELRDAGLLKLFFMTENQPELMSKLATEQLALHSARLAEYQRLKCEPENTSKDSPSQTLKMGLLYQQACLAFWSEILAQYPVQKSQK